MKCRFEKINRRFRYKEIKSNIKMENKDDDFEIIIKEFLDEEIDQKELTTYSYISNGLYFEYFIGYEISALLG